MQVHGIAVESEYLRQFLQLVRGLRRPQRRRDNARAHISGALWNQLQCSGCSTAYWQRPAHDPGKPSGGQCVTVIARKYLVTPVTRQGYRDMRPRHSGYDVGRNLRRIREWLVVHVGESRHNGEDIRGRNRQLFMYSAEMVGHRFCMR